MKLLSSRLVTPNSVAMVIGSIFSLGLLASPALSATYSVTNTNDSGRGSLRQAVLDANAAPGEDEIVFNLSGSGMKTITITAGQIEIADRLTISGLGRDQLTITKSNSSRRLLRVNLGARVTLKGVTIGNSQNTAGSTIGNFGNLTIQDSAIKNNTGTDGGAIVNGSARDSTTAINLGLDNVEFSNNTGVYGGAIDNFAVVTFGRCTFNGNTSELGGAIYNRESGSLRMGQSTFTQNKATFGGGIFNYGELMVVESSFNSNTASAIGGGIYSRGNATIRSSRFQGNAATEDKPSGRGTISPTGKMLPIKYGDGGGIINFNNLTLESSILENNRAANGGGGISNMSGTVRVKESTIRLNTATTSGPDVSGAFISEGGNEIGNATGSTGF